MQLTNPSPSLHNEDLAPAAERKWGAFSIFNVWTSDVHSLYGYFLAASLFLLCGNFINFVLAIGVGSIIIYALMQMVGLAGVRTGVPYPVLARASFGTFGANVPAIVRAIVACFWYGAQTSAASGAIVALLIRSPGMLEFHTNSHMLGHSTLEVICYVVVWALQLLIIQRGMETVRKFQDWAGPAVWIMMLLLAVYLVVKSGTFSFGSEIPADVLAQATAGVGISAAPGTFAALAAVAATWVTYFAALYLNFCDFSRYSTEPALRKGNLWGLPVNLLAFCLVAGVTTTAAFTVYGEVLLHPDQISAKFDSWFLAALAALTFAVATLGINVVANFVSPAFDFANVFPSKINFKRGGYIAAGIALVLYPWAPWNTGAAAFVNFIGSTMGPIFGIMMVDYYLIRKGKVDVNALYQENGEFSFGGSGWHVKAFVALAVGMVFSSILPTFTSVLPAWWGTYGWFVGVGIGGAVYFVLRMGDKG